MFLDDYIQMLQERRSEVGNIRVCMTQNGNYAEGDFAELYAHPLVKELQTNGFFEWVNGERKVIEPIIEEHLVLGHSDQWC